jgi:hypothetical protein
MGGLRSEAVDPTPPALRSLAGRAACAYDKVKWSFLQQTLDFEKAY